MKKLIIILAAAALVASCSKGGNDGPVKKPANPPAPVTTHSLLLYIGADNEFKDEIGYKLNTLLKELKPSHKGNVLMYADSRGSQGAALIRVYNYRGTNFADTLALYTPENSASREVLARGLRYMRDYFPADSYGLFVLSHASGWLPQSTLSSPRSIIADYTSNHSEMNIVDFAGAVADAGIELEYMMFDACLMGNVEVAYEFKDLTKYIIFSPSEVLVPNDYEYFENNYFNHIPERLLRSQPDVVGLAQDFYRFYAEEFDLPAPYTHYVTVSVVNTAQLEALAEFMRGILPSPSEAGTASDLSAVQLYRPAIGYDRYTGAQLGPHYLYFDLLDYVRSLPNVDAATLARLTALVREALPYASATPQYYSGYNYREPAHDITTYSGLTIYVPQPKYDEVMNPYYMTLKWAKKVYGL